MIVGNEAPNREAGFKEREGELGLSEALTTRSYRLGIDGLAQFLKATMGETTEPYQNQLRTLFWEAGIELSGREKGKSLFYNDKNGLMLVRASARDFDKVEQLVQVINVTPPQVMLDTKIIEIRNPGSGWKSWVKGVVKNLKSKDNNSLKPSLQQDGVEELAEKISRVFEASDFVATQVQHMRGDEVTWKGQTVTNA